MKPLLAGLMALTLFVTACGSSDDDTDAASPTTTEATVAAAEPDPEPTTTPQSDETDTSNEADGESEAAPSAEFVDDAPLFAGEFMPIDEGTHRFDTLGTEFTLTIEGEWWVQPNSATQAVFTHPDSRGPGDRDIVLLRVSALSDPTQPGAEPEAQGDGWPANDIAGWLDNLIDGLAVGTLESAVVGGLDAQRFQIAVDDDSVCGPFFCVGFATNQLVSSFSLEPGFDHTIYWVDQGDEDPIMVLIGSPAGDSTWRTTAEELLATMAFGETRPNPIIEGVPFWQQGLEADIPAGEATLPALGGISITFPTEQFVFPLGDGWLAVPFDMPADVEIFLASATPDGTPLTTIDEVVAQIGTDATVTEIDGATFPLGDARVFDIVANTTGEPNRDLGIATGEGGAIWARPEAGRVWLFETERGVVAVTAESFDGDLFVEQMIEQAELLLPSIELTDPPTIG